MLPLVGCRVLAIIMQTICLRHAVLAASVDAFMSDSELRQVFSVDRQWQVPSHEIVRVDVGAPVYRRGSYVRRVVLPAFGHVFQLDLVRNNDLNSYTRILQAEKAATSENIDITLMVNSTNSHVGHMYQDVNLNSALLVDENDKGAYVNGLINNLVIRHLPDNFQHVSCAKFNCTPVCSMSCQLHVVFHRTTQNSGHFVANDFGELMIDRRINNYSDRPRRPKREIPDLYPEVMVIVDFGLYAIHGYDAKKVKKYVLSFMNAVDLRYRRLPSPHVRLSIAGITVVKSSNSAPYLNDHMTFDNKLNAGLALSATGVYLFGERRLPGYDIVLVLTDRTMCVGGRACGDITTGYAYVGGGCGVSSLLQQVTSVALVQDSGGFSGVVVAAHELGHLLGAVHDGSPATRYLGGPGAKACRWTDGYIMSDLRRDERGLHWSACSVRQFHYFAGSSRSSCMHNAPFETIAEGLQHSPLPGKLTTVDAQCRLEEGSHSCFHDQRVCTQLYCYHPADDQCVAYRPAVEGSSCGSGVHCIDGQCVVEDADKRPGCTSDHCG